MPWSLANILLHLVWGNNLTFCFRIQYLLSYMFCFSSFFYFYILSQRQLKAFQCRQNWIFVTPCMKGQNLSFTPIIGGAEFWCSCSWCCHLVSHPTSIRTSFWKEFAPIITLECKSHVHRIILKCDIVLYIIENTSSILNIIYSNKKEFNIWGVK